jgi:hypothetical protein
MTDKPDGQRWPHRWWHTLRLTVAAIIGTICGFFIGALGYGVVFILLFGCSRENSLMASMAGAFAGLFLAVAAELAIRWFDDVQL